MPVIDNGSVSLLSGRLFGDVAHVTCDDSYVLQGNRYITCLDGPVWSELPTCLKGWKHCYWFGFMEAFLCT